MKPITWALSIGALAACTMASTGPGVAAAHTTATAPRIGLPSAHAVVDHRYVESVQLDHGALRVGPAPKGSKPDISRADALSKMLGDVHTMGYRSVVLGFGLVTIASPSPGVPSVTSLPAWIGFSKEFASFSCPMMFNTAGGETTTLPRLASNGYAAFVLGAATGAPALTYVAASEPCNSVLPPSLTKASEAISIPWQATGPVTHGSLPIDTTIPPCGTWRGVSTGGSVVSMTITVGASVPDVHGRCSGAKSVTEMVYLGPADPAPGSPPPVENSGTTYLHGPVGPMDLQSPGSTG